MNKESRTITKRNYTSKAERDKAREQRRAQGYDPNPPLCLNCKRFVKPMKRMGNFPSTAPFCSASGLTVSSVGVCDFWIGHQGAVLES